MQSRQKQHTGFDPQSCTSANFVRRRPEYALDASEPTAGIWNGILSIPGVREWRILRDIAFLLTTFPIGLAAFVVAVIGFAFGISLGWLLIGIPILIWTVGLTLRFAAHERARLDALLGTNLGEPRYPKNTGENAIRHVWTVLRSSQVRRDLVYMLFLLPIGIFELALVLLPLEFIASPLIHLAFGSIVSTNVLGFAINSRPEALLFLGIGLVLLMPMLLLMNVVTSAHSVFAERMLARR